MEKKVVLITGASNGIGEAMARVFSQNDYVVIINYNSSQDKALMLESELREKGYDALAIKADVSNSYEVKTMVNEALKTFGHIDILINNAGTSSVKLLIDESEENINKTISTNLIGSVYCTKEVIKNMIKRQYGKIINISSIWGNFGASMESIYSASKGGINAFTKAMAKELAYSNIQVNAIAPGVVDTKMMDHFTSEDKEKLKAEIPFGRFARPIEIAKLALFLASSDADYITGQIIQIDGGYCF